MGLIPKSLDITKIAFRDNTFVKRSATFFLVLTLANWERERGHVPHSGNFVPKRGTGMCGNFVPKPMERRSNDAGTCRRFEEEASKVHEHNSPPPRSGMCLRQCPGHRPSPPTSPTRRQGPRPSTAQWPSPPTSLARRHRPMAKEPPTLSTRRRPPQPTRRDTVRRTGAAPHGHNRPPSTSPHGRRRWPLGSSISSRDGGWGNSSTRLPSADGGRRSDGQGGNG